MADPGPAAPAAAGGVGGGGGGGRGQARNAATNNYLAQLPAQYLAEFRHEQAVMDNFFAYHRAGLSTLANKPWEDPNRLPPGTAPHNPGGNRGNNFWDGQYSIDPVAAVERQGRRRWFFRNLAAGSRRRTDAASSAARAARRYLRGQGCAVSLLEILGFGGNGVASLFEVDPGRGRERKKVVVKSLLRSGTNMREEKDYNLGLKRARHIIQMLEWTRELMGTDGASDEDRARWTQIDQNDGMLTLEYMKNGDVWGFLKKVAVAGQRIPNKILWKIFICLIRACISMRFPPRLRAGPNGQPFWQESMGPDLDEVVPDGPAPPRLELVHFDLDTKNILIGDFDNDEHQTAPTFKVSDFGLAKPVTHPHLNIPKGAWRNRRMGKTEYLLPEQFHKEWEYIDVLPSLEQPQPQVAGQYGAWSNIYAIALCMHLLISQAGPPYPPAAYGPMNTQIGDALLTRPTLFTDYWQNRVRPFYTHGYHLESEHDLDPELRYLLMRCMADLPADRPTLGELQAWIQGKEDDPDWSDPNDGTRAWFDGVFQAAPIPPSSAAAAHPSLATTPPPLPPVHFNFDWTGYGASVSMGQLSYSGDDDDDDVSMA